MTPERWQRIQEVFEGAADRPAAERAAWLEAACGGDPELLEEVRALLAHEGEGASFVQDLAAPAASRKIGPYTVSAPLGDGGMGTVYRAVRDDDPLRRPVAIKLIRQGRVTDSALRRFHRERQILAGLDHPYIARLLAGGTTAGGLPYFVMEYVQGLPINEFCHARRLGIPPRLRLLRQVCEAVQYAHDRGVIHRDLKPANVLVAVDGTPRLLDFGIAKLLDTAFESAGGWDPRMPMVTTARILTPEYASPEQVRGEAMTAATDVYSLGVMLYELLTGQRVHRLKGLSEGEIERVICHTPVTRPSETVQLTGDLDAIDAIVLCALAKDPGERYASVEALAEDMGRFLEGRPVVARLPPESPAVSESGKTGGGLATGALRRLLKKVRGA